AANPRPNSRGWHAVAAQTRERFAAAGATPLRDIGGSSPGAFQARPVGWARSRRSDRGHADQACARSAVTTRNGARAALSPRARGPRASPYADVPVSADR